jgi:hypothetical protein
MIRVTNTNSNTIIIINIIIINSINSINQNDEK